VSSRAGQRGAEESVGRRKGGDGRRRRLTEEGREEGGELARTGGREEDRGVGQKTAKFRTMLEAEDGRGAENEWAGIGKSKIKSA